MANLELRPVSDALGVEVLGLDLAKPLDDGTVKALEEA